MTKPSEIAEPAPPTDTLSRERFLGCLLGLALGDALGAPLEFMTRAQIAATHGEVREPIGGGWLMVDPGEYTDDTQMALALAESIIACRQVDPADIARRFVAWAASHPKDIGNITRLALRYHAQGVPHGEVGPRVCRELAGRCAGNGSVMRCAPVGLFHAARPEALVRDSLVTSALTHADPQSAWSTVAVNLAIADLVAGRREGLVERIAPQIKEPRVRETLLAAPGLARRDVRSGGFVLETLGAAFWALENHEGFEEVVVAAINLGDDADTVGAVAGALAGAREGVDALPRRWLALLHDADQIAAAAAALYRLAREATEEGAGTRE
ncbi:MAG TPA: ADP-ribosylglycohydrolase family protein [Thermomicrobiales bacterium]|nr:ADP-ribosylglycohydrolase family protein [Thermomicrobiales bacterium]